MDLTCLLHDTVHVTVESEPAKMVVGQRPGAQITRTITQEIPG